MIPLSPGNSSFALRSMLGPERSQVRHDIPCGTVELGFKWLRETPPGVNGLAAFYGRQLISMAGNSKMIVSGEVII